MNTTIHTDRAPKAIGTYSQAVRAGDTVYVSGQIPLDPATGTLVSGDIDAEIRRVFDNLKAIAEAAGGTLANAVKLTRVPDRHGALRQGQRDHGDLFHHALPGARGGRRGRAAARRPRRDGVHTQPRLKERGCRSADALASGRCWPSASRAWACTAPSDLLFVLPLRYEDRTRIVPIGALLAGQPRGRRGRGAARGGGVPPPPATAGAARRRQRFADAALLPFLECAARRAWRAARGCAATARCAAARSAWRWCIRSTAASAPPARRCRRR